MIDYPEDEQLREQATLHDLQAPVLIRDIVRVVELLCALLDPSTIVPIHYEGWKHFRQRREEARRAFDESPLADRVRWLRAGVAGELSV